MRVVTKAKLAASAPIPYALKKHSAGIVRLYVVRSSSPVRLNRCVAAKPSVSGASSTSCTA